MNNQINVIVAHSHNLALAGIQYHLSTQPRFVVQGVARTSEEVMAKCKSLPADVVILEDHFEGKDSVQLMETLCATYPHMRMIIVIANLLNGAARAIHAMVQKGARGCIHSNALAAEYVAALDRVSGGETYFSSEVNQILAQLLLSAKDGQTKEPQLTDRELQVLELVVKGDANKNIASTLNLSIRTVEKHRQKIMKKFNLHKATDLVRFALTRGLVTVT
jgi:DNA-binding NarL/FixJ family response regulator